MDKNKFGLIAAVVGVSIAVVDIVNITKKGRQDRKQIKANTEAEIKRINDAKDKVIQKMKSGEYDPTNLEQLMTNFQFEYIIADIDGRY